MIITHTYKFMEKINNDVLSVSCSDSIEVRARVTFDSCVVDGIQVTFWMDDIKNMEARVDKIFEILFEEVIKNRGKSV